MITPEERSEMVKKFGQDEKDTGSAPVQIAILTRRIENLKPHFNEHKKDFHSNRGLMKLIGRRKRLLRYYHKKDRQGYAKLIKSLGLRK